MRRSQRPSKHNGIEMFSFALVNREIRLKKWSTSLKHKILQITCAFLTAGHCMRVGLLQDISGGPWPDDRQPTQQVRGVAPLSPLPLHVCSVHCKKSWRSSSTPASGDAGPKHTGVEQSFRHPWRKFYYKYRTFPTFFTSVDDRAGKFQKRHTFTFFICFIQIGTNEWTRV